MSIPITIHYVPENHLLLIEGKLYDECFKGLSTQEKINRILKNGSMSNHARNTLGAHFKKDIKITIARVNPSVFSQFNSMNTKQKKPRCTIS